ncbi:type VI immunity family protein [Paracoccus aminophilus]|uniref:DUF3396 domain-containing protein n=1 Tax=Paracoccus aminophilus JCM 7686 TaxID=1367847 RepID=S5XV30_PARAH|nr:type VI immunity family protein [Paracoccus aminophilus]AGT09067.1 hypothetical protein JCM7686_1966 [Paracoccus aminophilus JCM 7686]
MSVDLSELMPILAALEARDQLGELDDVAFPDTGPVRWLFGLTSGFHFANGASASRRKALIGLAQDYYELTGARCNTLAYGEKVIGISSAADIEARLSNTAETGRFADPGQTSSFYIRNMPAAAIRSTDPVYESFAAFLPADGLRLNGNLTYSTRLSTERDAPEAYLRFFRACCEKLQVFYAVSGFSLLFYSYSARPRDAYPLLRRFPGLLYEDANEFGLETEGEADVIRDANWLTAINREMLDQLGGQAEAEKLEGVTLHPYPGGVVLQAGRAPRIGDVNAGHIPEEYRRVSDFLKPLRYAPWQAPYLAVPPSVDAMEATRDWMERFDG